MLIYVLGLILFFGTHLVRTVAPGAREAAIERFGDMRWRGLYAMASLLGFVLIVWGWMSFRADAAQIFVAPDWGRHVTYLLVLFAFVLVAAAYLPAGYIKTRLQHPFVTGVGLWGLGHIFANGDLAGLLLFGAFLAYSIIVRVSLAGRPDEGPEFNSALWDGVAVVVGLAGYVITLFWLHAFLFGVSPAG